MKMDGKVGGGREGRWMVSSFSFLPRHFFGIFWALELIPRLIFRAQDIKKLTNRLPGGLGATVLRRR